MRHGLSVAFPSKYLSLQRPLSLVEYEFEKSMWCDQSCMVLIWES